MCDAVIIHGKPVYYVETQGVLAARIGRDNIVMDEGAEYRGDDCLCPVNISQSAYMAGYKSSRKDPHGVFDPFNFHWSKP